MEIFLMDADGTPDEEEEEEEEERENEEKPSVEQGSKFRFWVWVDKSLALAKYLNYIRLETICPKDIAGAKNADKICISLTLKTHLQIIFAGIKHM